MNMTHPDGSVTSVSIEGQEFKRGAKGVFAIPDALAPRARRLLRMADAQHDAPNPGDEFDRMTRAELFAWFKQRGVKIAPATQDPQLIATARSYATSTFTPPPPAADPVDAAP